MRNSDVCNATGGIARSLIASLTFSLTFTLLGLAPSVTAALRAPSASANSITLTWTAPGDDGNAGRASQYDLRYSTAPITDANWNSAVQAIGEPSPQTAGATETFTVTGLTTGTLYYFAIKVADEVPNWSPLSNVVSRATDSETSPPMQITNLTASNPTTSSVRLSWTAPGDDGAVGTASQYDVRYSTSLATLIGWTNATQASDEPVPSVAGTAESFTVTGLNSGTTYYFGIKTADEVPNWSNLSNTTSIATTIEQVAPGAVTNLIAVLPTQTSLTLVWTAPGDDGNTGTAAQYDIRYSTSSINNGTFNSAWQITNEPAPSPAGTPESLTVTGLAENTTYYFAIKTADEVPNWSALSNVASGATTVDQTPPSAVTDLQASAGTSTGTISLSWTAPGDDGLLGTVTTYEIRYSNDSLTDANWESATVFAFPPTPLPSGLPQSATLPNLTPGSTYYVAMKAWDDAGNSSPMSNCDTAVAKLDISLGNDETDDGLPKEYVLAQNYPNPFNPTTQISVSLPRAGATSLTVFNSAGQQVATLLDGTLSAGEHTVEWDGTDDRGRHVATGVYYYRLAAGDFVQTRKMMLLK